MNIAKFKGFAVIAFSKKSLQLAVFRRIKTKYELLRHVSSVPDEENLLKSWKELFRTAGISKDEPLILCGALAKSFFFRTSMAEIPPKSVRNALMLELPRRMFAFEEENTLIEFSFPASGSKNETPDGEKTSETVSETDSGEMKINACVIPRQSMETLTEILLQCGKKADAYIYPFLALQANDPPLYLPEVEEKYYFANDSWQVAGNEDDPAKSNAEWEKIFRGQFKLPQDFSIKDSLMLLLCARYSLTSDFDKSEEGLNILPAKLRPSRLKSLLKLGGLLLVLLFANLLWSYSGEWIANAKSYKSLSREKASLQEEHRRLRSRVRKIEKERRERERSSLMKTGEHDIVKKLNDLTTFLPANVMVSSMRWNDSGVDLTMFSENSSSLSEIFRTKFPYWKLSNIQQRNFGGAATMITVKLVNNTENDPEEAGGR